MNSTRLAREEGIKRQVNEAIEGGLWPNEHEEIVRMRCECGSTDCAAFVAIRVVDYERVRENPRRFILADGHQVPEEVVVERTQRYLVVEKIGRAGEAAERLDPRSGSADEPAFE